MNRRETLLVIRTALDRDALTDEARLTQIRTALDRRAETEAKWKEWSVRHPLGFDTPDDRHPDDER